MLIISALKEATSRTSLNTLSFYETGRWEVSFIRLHDLNRLVSKPSVDNITKSECF